MLTTSIPGERKEGATKIRERGSSWCQEMKKENFRRGGLASATLIPFRGEKRQRDYGEFRSSVRGKEKEKKASYSSSEKGRRLPYRDLEEMLYFPVEGGEEKKKRDQTTRDIIPEKRSTVPTSSQGKKSKEHALIDSSSKQRKKRGGEEEGTTYIVLVGGKKRKKTTVCADALDGKEGDGPKRLIAGRKRSLRKGSQPPLSNERGKKGKACDALVSREKKKRGERKKKMEGIVGPSGEKKRRNLLNKKICACF